MVVRKESCTNAPGVSEARCSVKTSSSQNGRVPRPISRGSNASTKTEKAKPGVAPGEHAKALRLGRLRLMIWDWRLGFSWILRSGHPEAPRGANPGRKRGQWRR